MQPRAIEEWLLQAPGAKDRSWSEKRGKVHSEGLRVKGISGAGKKL